MTKINPEFKAKWVAALRSGEYKQTFDVLRDSEGFCCLGVACDILDPEGWKFEGGWWGHLGVYDLPTPEALKSMGIAVTRDQAIIHQIPFVTINGLTLPLHEQNDQERCSFFDIADAIEGQL